MIYALVLLASMVQAQEVSTDTLSVPIDTQIEISNLGKDTRSLLSGRYRQTGKPTFAGGFCFADGTCQNTYATPPTPAVSSYTYVPQQSTTQTTFSVAYASVTINASGLYNVKICFFGQNSQNNTGSRIIYGVKEDGVFVTPFTDSDYAYNFQSSNAAYNFLASWCIVLRKPSAGSHTYGLQVKVNANTGTFGQTDGALALYGVEEIPTP